MTRSVPGFSSAGRARSAPRSAIYSISPCQPCASHSSKRGSADDRSASAMPTAWKPSSLPHCRMLPASALKSMSSEFKLPGEAATLRLGEALARGVAPGRVLHLSGELGTGKTTVVRGMLRALGHPGRVKSPTYTLVEPYSISRLHFYHFDLFRFKDKAEWLSSGFPDYFGPESVCAVEWPERAGGLLPPPDLDLRLMLEGAGRRATLKACTPAGASWAASLPSSLPA